MRRPAALLAAAALAAACVTPAARSGAPAAAAPDRSHVPPAGPPPRLQVPAQRHFQLANGLRVRLVEYHRLPIVALQLVLDAGAAHDPPARPGLASFTAAMVTEGTRTRTATQISDEVGFLGASLSAGASFDAAFLSGATLSRHLPRFLEVVGDVVANASFPERDFARVQDQRLVALVQQRDSPQSVASKAFAPAFWGDHPYGHWAMGDEASVKAATRGELARFHARMWRPGGAELVVVGDVGEAELRPLLERTLGAWAAGEPPPAVRAEPLAPAARTVLVEKAGAPQSFVLMGLPGVTRSSPEWYASEVTYQILGGGMASRLMRDLREEHGYTYGVSADGEARRLGGFGVIGGGIRTEVTGAALKEILSQIEELRERPVPAQELADAKRSLVLSLPGEFATAAGIAGRLAEEAIFGLPDGYWDEYAAAVERVTAEDVRAFARRHLDPARLVTVMVCQTEAVRRQIAGLPLGPVEVRPAPGSPAAPVGAAR